MDLMVLRSQLKTTFETDADDYVIVRQWAYGGDHNDPASDVVIFSPQSIPFVIDALRLLAAGGKQ